MKSVWHFLILSSFVGGFACMAVQPETARQKDQRSVRLMMTNGDVYEVAILGARDSGVVTHTAVVRDLSGSVVTVQSSENRIWNSMTFSVSDGTTTLEGRWGTGFLADKLPSPFEVRIGNEVYRALIDDTNTITEPLRRMRGAASKLPASFLAKLRNVLVIANSGFTEMPLGIGMFGYLFTEKLPEVELQAEDELSPDEGSTIFDRRHP